MKKNEDQNVSKGRNSSNTKQNNLMVRSEFNQDVSKSHDAGISCVNWPLVNNIRLGG